MPRSALLSLLPPLILTSDDYGKQALTTLFSSIILTVHCLGMVCTQPKRGVAVFAAAGTYVSIFSDTFVVLMASLALLSGCSVARLKTSVSLSKGYALHSRCRRDLVSCLVSSHFVTVGFTAHPSD